ncbi:MAG: NADH-quinone oxidoreductase subunit L [Planctomycetota bacterium]|nr:NADH-quinone oxidoreductase subunit L [Planctomycetota bacterium]MDA1105129.1 NADH-quinone oxidoreductase subunit L [Planctomycetota bacterium]
MTLSPITSMLPGTMLASSDVPAATIAPEFAWLGWALALPAISALACTLMALCKVKGKLPGWLTVASLGTCFVLILKAYQSMPEGPIVVPLAEWMSFSWGPSDFHSLQAALELYIDRLTIFWMLFVSGLGTLIALYATEYMEHDVKAGYARFFAGVSIFLFAMTALVMGGNLLLLYLGWEGVGLASYMLIGYFFTRPSAVAAAKKAFIVNRIGDLGLALGIFLTWRCYGTIEYSELFQIAGNPPRDGPWEEALIPYLLMLGAFGKSAQGPLYVWLPDAMEGPTPVSALIHAATMVTAGVFLIARCYPLFLLQPDALTVVAWIGGLTAFWAATIGMAQYDMKRVWAYSTISQLGYMFLGLGLGTTFGACFHTFTHAFFKACLFLTAGAVMHGFAGQLDIRKLSGLSKIPGFRMVSWFALLGALWLAAFPFSAAFFSKDEILSAGVGSDRADFQFLGWLGLFTAGLTAYYTFRVWFRAFAGPVHFEPGEEVHAHGEFHPHSPRWAMKLSIAIIGIGAVLAGYPAYEAMFLHKENWVQWMMAGSTAVGGAGVVEQAADHAAEASSGHQVLGMSAHAATSVAGSIFGIGGILIALYLHLIRRSAADSLRRAIQATPLIGWIPGAAENKWYVDEIYNAVFCVPLWVTGHVLHFIDKHILDAGVVDGIGSSPSLVGRVFRPLYGGVLQSYAVTMAGGVGLILAWLAYTWLRGGF